MVKSKASTSSKNIGSAIQTCCPRSFKSARKDGCFMDKSKGSSTSSKNIGSVIQTCCPGLFKSARKDGSISFTDGGVFKSVKSPNKYSCNLSKSCMVSKSF